MITTEGSESSLSDDNYKKDNKDYIVHVDKGMCIVLSSYSIAHDDNNNPADGSIIIDSMDPFQTLCDSTTRCLLKS